MMKKDMDKIITERRRRNNIGLSQPKGYKKALYKTSLDEQQSFEPIAKKWKICWGGKEFNDNLNPLKKYLRKNCGRQWNDVWSEICSNYSDRNISQSHLRDHVKYMVYMNAKIEDSKVVTSEGHSFYWQFYVCPITGKLREYIRPAKKRYRNIQTEWWWNTKNGYYMVKMENNIWYSYSYEIVKSLTKEECGILKNNLLATNKDKRIYDSIIYCENSILKLIKKKQLSNKEIIDIKTKMFNIQKLGYVYILNDAFHFIFLTKKENIKKLSTKNIHCKDFILYGINPKKIFPTTKRIFDEVAT